jgi:hypothetical protein
MKEVFVISIPDIHIAEFPQNRKRVTPIPSHRLKKNQPYTLLPSMALVCSAGNRMARTPGFARPPGDWAWNRRCEPADDPGRSRAMRRRQILDLSRLNAPFSSPQRGQPYGEDPWARKTARRLGLELTLRARGRPRKVESNEA